MVLEILANCGLIEHDRNLQASEHSGRPHPRGFKELNRSDGPSRENELLVCEDINELVVF